jgi:hypothetical protein
MKTNNPFTIILFLELAVTLKDCIKFKNYRSAFMVKDAMVAMNCQEIAYDFIQELFRLLPPREAGELQLPKAA